MSLFFFLYIGIYYILQAQYLSMDIGLHEEKDYIESCLFQDYTIENFSKMIMQNFFKGDINETLYFYIVCSYFISFYFYGLAY